MVFIPEPENEHDSNDVIIAVRGQRVGYVNRLQTAACKRWISECEVGAVIERVNGTSERPRIFVFVKVRPNAQAAA